MKIYGMKCREVMAGAGSFAVIAEAEVEKDGESVFATVQDYDGVELTVSKNSVYAFLVDDAGEPADEFLEEYTSWKDAKESVYAPVFEKLKKVIKMLEEN